MTTQTELAQSEPVATQAAVLEEPVRRVCSNCHADDPKLEYLEHEGKCLCVDCYDEQVAACRHCGNPFWQDDMTTVGGELYCEDCLNEHFRYCSACEEYVDAERASYSEIHDCDYCENCFNNYVTYCSSCDSQIDPERCHVNDDGESFCDECWEHRDDPERGENLEFSGDSFQRCRSGRKYGLEIEVLLKESGDHLPADQQRCWKQVQDGSLGDSGREFVSPIFHGDQGFDEIEVFTKVLKDYGYCVKRQCGLHIHIDGRDLECGDIKKLLKITRYFEPVIYAMLPESRYNGLYAVPLERFPKSRFRIATKDEDALKRLWYGKRDEKTVNLKSKYHSSRYYGLNIHSWFFRRSLEFRYHSGTLNPLKIENFVVICQALVDKAKAVKKFTIPEPCDFQMHFARFVSFLELAPELVFYMRERIMKFHPEKLQEPALAQA